MSFPDVTHLPLFEHALNDSSIEQTFGFDNMGLVHQPSPQVDKSPTQIFSSSAKPKFHLRMYANPNIVGCHSKATVYNKENKFGQQIPNGLCSIVNGNNKFKSVHRRKTLCNRALVIDA